MNKQYKELNPPYSHFGHSHDYENHPNKSFRVSSTEDYRCGSYYIKHLHAIGQEDINKPLHMVFKDDCKKDLYANVQLKEAIQWINLRRCYIPDTKEEK